MLVFTTDAFSLSIGILLEKSVDILSEKLNEHNSFVEWSTAYSALSHSAVKIYEMPEAIVALDSAMVGGQPYLCVAYLHDVMVLKVPPCNPTHQEQWIKQPYISHRSRFKISHVKLRYRDMHDHQCLLQILSIISLF